MAFCGNCGTQAQDGVKFCPKCGQAMGGAAGASPEGQQAQGAPDYAPPVVPGAPTQGDISDAQNGKTMGILAYILFFIPLLTGAHKTSPFVKYHTNQGTVLFICAAAYGIVYAVLSAILIFIPVIGWLLITILGIASLLIVVLCVVGIINAVNGRMKPLPLIGGINIIK
jgi:uncharacterized membrane protein